MKARAKLHLPGNALTLAGKEINNPMTALTTFASHHSVFGVRKRNRLPASTSVQRVRCVQNGHDQARVVMVSGRWRAVSDDGTITVCARIVHV